MFFFIFRWRTHTINKKDEIDRWKCWWWIDQLCWEEPHKENNSPPFPTLSSFSHLLVSVFDPVCCLLESLMHSVFFQRPLVAAVYLLARWLPTVTRRISINKKETFFFLTVSINTMLPYSDHLAAFYNSSVEIFWAWPCQRGTLSGFAQKACQCAPYIVPSHADVFPTVLSRACVLLVSAAVAAPRLRSLLVWWVVAVCTGTQQHSVAGAGTGQSVEGKIELQHDDGLLLVYAYLLCCSSCDVLQDPGRATSRRTTCLRAVTTFFAFYFLPPPPPDSRTAHSLPTTPPSSLLCG